MLVAASVKVARDEAVARDVSRLPYRLTSTSVVITRRKTCGEGAGIPDVRPASGGLRMGGGRRRPHSDRASAARRPPYGRHIACIGSAYAGRAVRSRPRGPQSPSRFHDRPATPRDSPRYLIPENAHLKYRENRGNRTFTLLPLVQDALQSPENPHLSASRGGSMRSPGLRGGLPQTLTDRCSAENPQSILVLTMYI